MGRTKDQGKPCDTLKICSKKCSYHKYYGSQWFVSICPYLEEDSDLLKFNDTYVVVREKKTGRAFSLDRAYCLKDSDMGIVAGLPHVVDYWDGWLPSLWRQLPEWLHSRIKTQRDLKKETKNFEAYWLF